MARRQHRPAPPLQMGQPSGQGPMGSSETRAGRAEVWRQPSAGAGVLPRNLPKNLVCFPRTTRPGPRTQAGEGAGFPGYGTTRRGAPTELGTVCCLSQNWGPWRRFSCPFHSGAILLPTPTPRARGSPAGSTVGLPGGRCLWPKGLGPNPTPPQALRAASAALAWHTYTRRGQVLIAG